MTLFCNEQDELDFDDEQQQKADGNENKTTKKVTGSKHSINM